MEIEDEENFVKRDLCKSN